MAKVGLAERSAVEDFGGTYGDVTLAVRDGVMLASLAAATGKSEALRAAVSATYGIALPSTPSRVVTGDVAAVWNGREQWLVTAERGSRADLERELSVAVKGLGAVTDQSDARVIFTVSGPRAREVLAKGIPVDLHERVFGTGSVAITHASHIGVVLWQVDAVPTFELAVFRSYASSFADWLEAAVQVAS